MTQQSNDSEIKKSITEKHESTPGSILNKIKMFEPKNTAPSSIKSIARSSTKQPKTVTQEPIPTVKKEIEPKVDESAQEDEDKTMPIKDNVKSADQSSIESINKNKNQPIETINQNNQEDIPVTNVSPELNTITNKDEEIQSKPKSEPFISNTNTQGEMQMENKDIKRSSVLDKIKTIDSKIKPPSHKERKLKSIQPPSSNEKKFSSLSKPISVEGQNDQQELVQSQLQTEQEKQPQMASTEESKTKPIEPEIVNKVENEPQSIEALLENKTIPEVKQIDSTAVPETKLKQMNKLFGDTKPLGNQENMLRGNSFSSNGVKLNTTEPIAAPKENQIDPLQTEEIISNKAKNILQSAKTVMSNPKTSSLPELDESTVASISDKKINPVNEEIFIPSVELPIEIVNESFCEGFFIATIPKDKGKVVENSEGFIASCNHLICSDLPAMQPEIVYRYPEKDTKTLELNNLAASICFPTGIKICYELEDPVSVKNYSSPITNQQGDRYYMMTYHFFYKMLNCEFIKTYSVYPLKCQMMKFCSDFSDKIELDKKTRKKIDEQLEQCQELNFRDIVYVPYCICLISKYPYLREMEHALESLRIQLSNYRSTSEEIVKFVSYLIDCIPIPPLNSKLIFGLPHSNQLHEISSPKYQEMNFLNKDLYCILNVLSIENIILIFRLMIFEQKILFVDNEFCRLSEISEGFASLIYPFQ